MRKRRLIEQNASAFEGINATPLIDVVMCLIIFFLIVGKLASDRGVAVNLPEARSGRDEAAPTIMVVTVARADPATAAARSPGWADLGVTVQADGQFMADARALEGAVRVKLSEHPQTSVQLRADRELSFGVVEPVLRATGQGGAKTVRFAAEKPL